MEAAPPITTFAIGGTQGNRTIRSPQLSSVPRDRSDVEERTLEAFDRALRRYVEARDIVYRLLNGQNTDCSRGAFLQRVYEDPGERDHTDTPERLGACAMVMTGASIPWMGHFPVTAPVSIPAAAGLWIGCAVTTAKAFKKRKKVQPQIDDAIAKRGALRRRKVRALRNGVSLDTLVNRARANNVDREEIGREDSH